MYLLCICIYSNYLHFEVGVSISDFIASHGLLVVKKGIKDVEEIRRVIV
jgi:hypothetical protein